MYDSYLFEIFLRFALTAALGLLIGLERGKGASDNTHIGTRDFVIFAVLGATSTFVAQVIDAPWTIAVGFAGFFLLLLSGYWADRRQSDVLDPGITTELAAVLTFFLGVLVAADQIIPGIALAILVVAVLSQKESIGSLRANIQDVELNATLKFLLITFIILPVLPNTSLDQYLTMDLGEVSQLDEQTQQVWLEPDGAMTLETGQQLALHDDDGRGIGEFTVDQVDEEQLRGTYEGEYFDSLQTGEILSAELNIPVVSVMLSAIKPYKVWLIVVLVSFISYIGYVLVKLLGAKAGIGLTGLIGGLASSTVTTLSFAKRSLEAPAWNRSFAVAVILASSVMFPRLLLEVMVVNMALAKNMMVPLLIMGATGLLVALLYHLRSRGEVIEGGELKLDNPFSLKSAISFGLVFASVLMLTRLAITYLGDAWLPLVALVSGLTDADAIAFSISDAQHAGLITLDWASFNIVLGALSNTFMKLFLVLALGDRGLFKYLLLAFSIIGAVGIVTMFMYYDVALPM
jgi:uncharacterized membrane protein (DUF4010 family)